MLSHRGACRFLDKGMYIFISDVGTALVILISYRWVIVVSRGTQDDALVLIAVRVLKYLFFDAAVVTHLIA